MRPLLPQAVGAIDHPLDPGHQLARLDRLHQVVVGAELERPNLAIDGVQGGQHDDLRPSARRPFPDSLAH